MKRTCFMTDQRRVLHGTLD